jgi:hypothetical protein
MRCTWSLFLAGLVAVGCGGADDGAQAEDTGEEAGGATAAGGAKGTG